MNDEMVTICLDRGGRISEYKLPFENGMNALSAIRTITCCSLQTLAAFTA